MSGDDDFAARAEALLAATRRGARDEVAARIAAVVPEVEKHVRGVVTRNARLLATNPALTADDIVQEVLARLVRSPPTGEAARPAAALLAWAGTTALRYMIDARERPRVRTPDGDDDVRPLERVARADLDFRTPDAHAERTELRGEINHARRVLDEHYPRGLDLLDAEFDHPDESDAVLASVLGTSAANVQQIRHRRLAILARWMSASEPTARQ